MAATEDLSAAAAGAGATYTNRMRKSIIERINCLTPTEHEEIFAIIRGAAGSATFTRNNNGVFFNLASLPDDVMAQIDRFVAFCMDNKQALDEYDKKLNESKLGIEMAIAGADGADIDAAGDGDEIAGANGGSVAYAGPDPAGGASSRGAPCDPLGRDWAVLLEQQTRIDPGFQRYISTMYADKHAKRKLNTRYYAAKKKYAKRAVQPADKREGAELADVLLRE